MNRDLWGRGAGSQQGKGWTLGCGRGRHESHLIVEQDYGHRMVVPGLEERVVM